jgi:hypothetical protein
MAPHPAPVELLAEIGSALNKHGHPLETLKRVGPLYDVASHGLSVGGHLIKANLDLGQIGAARTLIDQLYEQKRPEWKSELIHWDRLVSTTRAEAEAVFSSDNPDMLVEGIRGPLWLREGSAAANLFPKKTAHAPAICFFGGSADLGDQKDLPLSRVSAAGCLSRALPLFLSEQVYLRTTAASQFVQPFLKSGGFALFSQPWPDSDAAHYARQCTPCADYAAILHLSGRSEPWTIGVRLVRTIDGVLIATTGAKIHPEQTESAAIHLANSVLELVQTHLDASPVLPSTWYTVPRGVAFDHYLACLDRGLAIAFGTAPEVDPEFHGGERETISLQLQLCLDYPQNVSARLLLIRSLFFLKKIRPQVVREYWDKIMLLNREHPLPTFVQLAIRRTLDDVFPR